MKHFKPVSTANQPFALVALGVDNLDTLEELFGEKLANAVCAELQKRFMAIIPRIAEIVETRHRRFLLTLPGFDELAVHGLVHQLQRAAASAPVDTSHGAVAVTLSAGCAFGAPGCPEDRVQAPALHALHQAIHDGVGVFRVAQDDAALLEYRSRLLSLSKATVGAVASDDLALAYQPVVHANGGHVISFHECLARLRQSDGKLLTAAEFMPAIERLGLAPMIDRQVLAMTLDTLRAHPVARFAVNIFPHTVQDAEWLAVLEAAIAEDESVGERLIVEITESAAILDVDRTRAFMDRLRTQGVSFALDDFGAGHTSIRYLRDFRFDILKIDGQFIRDIDRNPDNAFLVDTFARYAERFEMMTVAEAIQTPAEARCLQDIGIEFFQGFQFGSPSLKLEPTSKPMPAVAAQA
ncbi:MAG: EAL domain-containing protein [Pseudomonadota bacterium]